MYAIFLYIFHGLPWPASTKTPGPWCRIYHTTTDPLGMIITSRSLRRLAPDKTTSGWWARATPSWKMMEFVNWDDDINPSHMGKCQKWQPVTTNQTFTMKYSWNPSVKSRELPDIKKTWFSARQPELQPGRWENPSGKPIEWANDRTNHRENWNTTGAIEQFWILGSDGAITLRSSSGSLCMATSQSCSPDVLSMNLPWEPHVLMVHSCPIGSMYGIYANIWGILMVNVTIYGIHGSYGC